MSGVVRGGRSLVVLGGLCALMACGDPPGGPFSGVDLGGDSGAEPDDPAPEPDPPAVIDSVALYLSGHSLFNLEMPALLEQIATAHGKTHHYNIQMGLGSTMAFRLSGDGVEQDKTGASMTYSVQDELASAATIAPAAYDTLLVTEAVDIFDHLLYSDTIGNLRVFYDLLVDVTPHGRVFFYDSWDSVGEVGGGWAAWVAHTEAELLVWECIIAAVNADPVVAANPVRLTPGGATLAHVVEAVLAGEVPGVDDPWALFAPDGHHLSPLGNYVIALGQYAMLYEESPEGGPLSLPGLFAAVQVPEATAAALEALAWDAATAAWEATLAPPQLDGCQVEVASYCGGNGYCEGLVAGLFAE